ncbi:MAG: hypothetical protein NTV63_02910 [Candidatus Woesearchaeota archaeon]|nr:hypothetical protein [Candidatus Woesearchaeota archaeon]
MEYRRIVKSGNTSYVISVPQKWVREQEIKKGDLLSIEESREHNLIISPREIKGKVELREARINAEETSPEMLVRSLVSAYINGYSSVEIRGKNLNQLSKEIRATMEQLIAFEIMEYTPERIYIKDYLKIDEISIDSLIRKMDSGIKSMIAECSSALSSFIPDKNPNRMKACFESLENMDRNINRLSFLASKIIRKSLYEPATARMLGLLPLNLLIINKVMESLENIGDNIKNLARNFEQDTPREEAKFIAEALKNAMENYNECMKSYFSSDKMLSNRVSDEKHMLRKKNEEFVRKKRHSGTIRAIERIQALESFIGVISRTVIDVV